MKRLISCAVTFCLAFSLFGVPSLAFAKDALASGESTQSGVVDSSSAASQSSSSSAGTTSDQLQGSTAEGSDSGETDGVSQNPVSENLVPQSNVTETVDGDITFFGIDDAQTQADAAPVATKGSQLSGAIVTVKLRSQIHPSSPSNNLTADFGVKAQVVDKQTGDVISSAEFVPATSATGGEANDETRIIGDYVAAFPDRIPAGAHELRVSGQNYLTHVESNFAVEDGNRINVKLVDMVACSNADTSVSTTVDANKNIQGLLPYGDFDGNGRIDNNDTWMMTRALSQPPTAADVAKYDINADGVFNLLDMQYFATTIKEGNDTASSVESLIEVIHGKPIITKDCSQTKVSTSDAQIKIGNFVGSDGGSESGDSPEDFTASALREALFENPDLSVILEQYDPISEANPVSLEIETSSLGATTPSDPDGSQDSPAVDNPVIEMEGLAIRPPAMTTSNKTEDEVSSLSSGVVSVEDENGTVHEFTFANGQQTGVGRSYSLVDTLLRSGSETAHAADNTGSVVIDFGTRIAIKKITIKVTATTKANATLAEIGKVEFLNKMADRIDPPDLSVPTNLKGEPGDKKISFTWDPQLNITGYEVRMTSPEGKTTVNSTVLPAFSIADKKMKSGTYVASVRSTNGDWKSPWSDEVSVELVPTKRPDMPTGISVTGGYRELIVSWPAVEDAAYYNMYYREASASQFTAVSGNITNNRYTLSNLKGDTAYVLYLTASNNFGTSPKSEDRTGTTLGEVRAKVPWYNLINRTAQHKEGTGFEAWNAEQAKANDNIASIAATAPNDDTVNPGFDPYWMVDGDYGTGYVPSRMSTYYDGARVVFDDAYDMDSLIITSSFMDGYGYTGVADLRVNIKDANGNASYYNMSNGTVTTSAVGTDAPNSFMVKFPKSSVKEITVGSMRAYGWKAAISEIAFYKYDSISDDLDAIWDDDLHTVLKSDVDGTAVDSAYLDQLEARINTVDPDCNEYAPNRALLLQTLAYARQALEFGKVKAEPARIYSSIDSTTNANVGGINSWQPIGVAAQANDKLQVFVGGRANAGSDPITAGPSPLVLGVSQNGGETKDVYTTIGQLNYGVNEITVPSTGNSIATQETGGQLYVVAQTSNKSMEFNVRVIGGADIACLNLYKVTDDAEYRKRCEAYVDDLNEQVAKLQETHANGNHSVEKYTPQGCFANTTDIMLNSIMFSVPATSALGGLGNSASRDQQVDQLIRSTKSSEEMMQLFWQHKGLGAMTTAEQQLYGGKNGIPAGHLNPRYVRTNPGVFMYAAGNHIGIQYGSTSVTGTPGVTCVKGSDGLWESGYYFGWGLAHEIGHQINNGGYTYAETTNNYYAQLITANDTNERSRYNCQSLYDRVTSGTKAPPSGKTGIGLYWSLHLAYDNGYNYKQYSNYTDLYNNLIMARIDSISRNPEKAPGTGFTLAGADKDNTFMRLACAAAGDAQSGFGRNLLDYFEAWGQTPDDTTIAYASQFPKEQRLIQYVNDDARVYRIQGGQSVGANTEVWADLYEGGAENIGDDSKKITDSRTVNTRQVTLKMGINGNAANKTEGLIGFEILRNGKAVAFQAFNPTKSGDQNTSGEITYTDTIVTENNRTYTYEVRAVDNLLNTSKNTVKFPQIKVSDKGTYTDKSRWTATTNMTSSDDQDYNTSGENVGIEGEANSSCEGVVEVSAVSKVIDGDASTAYTGTIPTGDKAPVDSTGAAVDPGAPYVEVDFGSTLQVTGITVPHDDDLAFQTSTIQVSTDGTNWTTLSRGTGVPNANDDSSTYYFDVAGDNQLKIYPASKLRLVGAVESTGMTLHEIDVVGPVGDNADFLDAEGWVGYIDADTTYAPETVPGENTIPQGSLVFVGNYSGDTAYNAFKLYSCNDQGASLIGGTQVLFAQEPAEGRNLGKTADGRWIWYITPDEMAEAGWTLPTSIAAELYRVDDAMTLESERLVANTLTKTLPSKIPTIHLNINSPTDMGDPTAKAN